MKIVSSEIVDMTKYGNDTNCLVSIIHVKILDINKRAKEIIDTISAKSWITRLGPIDQIAYEARAAKTIKKIVEDILNKVTDKVTEDFGEYLVSDSAGNALIEAYQHNKITLAELWKEQMSGNPGFDFHTESATNLIVYGEAKFKTDGSPYTIAIEQIVKFIEDKKDLMELVDLQHFVSKTALENAQNDKKGFIAAFSLNAVNHAKIFENALKLPRLKELTKFSELFLIGVEG